ncbi:MAG: lipoprotein [Azoarcus sp.]|nr:lipoprotein [Azoarcus sp.]
MNFAIGQQTKNGGGAWRILAPRPSGVLFANIQALSEKPFMRALMVAAVCALLLSACGIKGPLYLPPADPVPVGVSSVGETPVDPPSSNDPE